jgi:nitrite reductase (NO-forming)
MMFKASILVVGMALVFGSMAACSPADSPPAPPTSVAAATQPTSGAADQHVAQTEPDVAYTLRTGPVELGLVFTGVGGAIDGVTNPPLTAEPGDVVSITLINGDGILHDLALDDFGVRTAELDQNGDMETIVFQVTEAGEFVYYCSLPGHREAGMWGVLTVGQPPSLAAEGAEIIRHPSDVPAPIDRQSPDTIDIELTAEEVVGQLADGTTFTYFTFNGRVPGPMLRVRVGDTVRLTLSNDSASSFAHSIDLHAVNGPGGGEVFTQTAPGGQTSFTFQALNPGLYVYHCATPSVAHHIANGMYGLILVEPEGGLPEVDREFYVMQGEIYTAEPHGTPGQLTFSHADMLNEQPQYFVFNGAAGALTGDEHALRANVGETVRIFFGVGGPNFTSAFHVIGEIFDRAYSLASVTTPPLTDVQTILVPPGGAGIVEFTLEVPGRYILVDHALSRVERGLAGFLYVEGEENPEVFQGP